MTAEFKPVNLAQLYASADQSVASAMQMNMLALQASRMREEFQREDALRNLASAHFAEGTGDLRSFSKAAMRIDPLKAPAYAKMADEAEKTALERAKLQGDVDEQRRKGATDRLKLMGDASTAPYLEWKKLVDGGMPDEQARERVQPMFVQGLRNLVESGLFSDDQMRGMKILQSPQFDPTVAKSAMDQVVGSSKQLEQYFKDKEPKSDFGKFVADFKSGAITKENLDAEVKKRYGQKWEYDKDRGILVNTESGESKAVTSPAGATTLPPRAGDAEGLRKEFNAREEVKNYNAAVPVLRSIAKAPDTGAGDLDLIYGVGKILDPGSVVREGEMALTIKTGTPIERLLGMASFSAAGGGRITPAQREKLIEAMHGRVTELRAAALDARKPYEAQATRQGIKIDETLTLPDLPELGKGKAAPGAGSQVFDSMPNPAQYRNRRIKAEDGTTYRSNGTEWVKE